MQFRVEFPRISKALDVDILSRNRALIGFSYNRGKFSSNDQVFHELGVGIGILNLYLTFY